MINFTDRFQMLKFKFIICPIFCCFFLAISAQRTPTMSDFQRQQKQQYQSTLGLAKQIGDVGVVTQTLYNLIALEGNLSSYRDSLAIHYYANGELTKAIRIAQRVLEADPKNSRMLEIDAYSLEQIGDRNAQQAYQALYAHVPTPTNGYKVAYYQQQSKAFKESLRTLQSINLEDVSKEPPAMIRVTFLGKKQEVPLVAAIANLKGLNGYQLKDYELARRSFEKALQFFPKFKAAKQSLLALRVMIE